MSRLIPDGFLTIRQAAARLVVALYSGVPDRSVVKKVRELGLNVADGVALDHAVSEIWAAVDKGKLNLFLVGARRHAPLKFPAEMSKGIPLLRSPRGADFNFLRPANPIYPQFVEWFGSDLSTVTVVFREQEIEGLARVLLRTRRRRRTKSVGQKKVGRPSRSAETKEIIRRVIDQRRWSPTQSLKALTQEVNRRSKSTSLFSEDSVARALDQLHTESGDRRFERVRRTRRRPYIARG